MVKSRLYLLSICFEVVLGVRSPALPFPLKIFQVILINHVILVWKESTCFIFCGNKNTMSSKSHILRPKFYSQDTFKIYICRFNSVAHTIKCLSTDSLCIFYLCVAYYNNFYYFIFKDLSFDLILF